MEEEKPELKGVVIISLPPPDNPSEGKTVRAAFTFGRMNTVPVQQQQQQQQQQQGHHDDNNASHLPQQVMNLNPQRSRFRFQRLGLIFKRACAIFMVAAMTLAVWNWAPYPQFEQQNDKEYNDENLAVYRIYPKYILNSSVSVRNSPPLRLRILFERDKKRNVVLMSDTEKEQSTGFLMKGDAYPNGLYYVSMLFGSPPRPYHLDMDTGSDLTWLQCDAPCRSCAKGPHPLFKPKPGQLVSCRDPLCKVVQEGLTNTYDCSGSSQCDYEIAYADRSFSMGILVRDTISMLITNGSLVRSNFVFGCAYDQQGSLAVSPSLTDGLLGLSNSQVSLPAQLARQGVTKNVVGHCISGNEKGGGYMFFGDGLKLAKGITWVQMQKKPFMKLYSVGTPNMKLGNTPLVGSGAGKGLGVVIFDSGSSFTYLSKEAYNAFVSEVKESLFGKGLVEDQSDSAFPICWHPQNPINSIEEVTQLFSPLTLDFGSSPWLIKSRQFKISPEGYLVKNSRGNICLGILDGSTLNQGNLNIIGDISLQRHLIIYDNENNQIGWIPNDCQELPEKFKSFPFFI